MNNLTYPLVPEPMQRSWLERNARWKIPLGCLTLLLLLAAFVGGLMGIIAYSFHNSEVFKEAMSRASADSQVRAEIGEPLRQNGFITGQLEVSESTGKANLSIPISGPRGKGAIHAVATKDAGVWRFSELQVSVRGHSGAIDLLSGQAPPEQDF